MGDLSFRQRIMDLDAERLTMCYQCGTCSGVCPISGDDGASFPRMEMILSQRGMIERLMGDAAIWLCHQCAACSTYCPRDARPANVMAALREYSIAHHAFPGFMGRALNDPRFLPLLFALPAVVLLGALALAGNLGALPGGEIVFAKFMPHVYVEAVFIAAVGFALTAGGIGARRYWRAMGPAAKGPGAVWGVLGDILRHHTLNRCRDDRVGDEETYKGHLPKSHLAAFYGFAGLFVTTNALAVAIYGFDLFPPLPQLHPIKLLGNVSGVVLLVAVMVFVHRRLFDGEKAGKTTYNDWLFVLVLLGVALSGFLSEISRLAESAALAYPVYFVHLVLIFFLLAYSPYSKFAHVFYRPTAMLFERLHRLPAGQRGQEVLRRAGP